MEKRNNGNYHQNGNNNYGNQYNNSNQNNNNYQMNNNNSNQNNNNYQMNNNNSNQNNNNYQMNNNNSNQNNNNYQMNNNNGNGYMNFSNNEANDNYNYNYNGQINQSVDSNDGFQYSETNEETTEKKKDPLMMAIYALAVVIVIGIIIGVVAVLGGDDKKEPKDEDMASGLPPITEVSAPADMGEASLEPSASGELIDPSASVEPTGTELPNMTLTPTTTEQPGPGQWMTFTPTQQPAPTQQTPEGPSGGLIDNIAPAPDFAVMDDKGGYINLMAYRENKPCVLCFWTSTTDASSDNLKEFNKVYFGNRGRVKFMMVSVTGMNGESVDAAKNYIKDKRYHFPIYHDTSRGASGAYQVSTVPSTYFITKDGKVAYYKVGPISKHDLEDGIKKIK